MYRTKTSFCLLGGLGSQSQPCDVLTGMACTWVVGKTHPSLCPAPPQSPPREMFQMVSLISSDFTNQDQMLSPFFSGSFFWIRGSLLRTEDIKAEQRATTISPSLTDFFTHLWNEGSESSEGWWGLYIIFRWTVSLSLCLLALHWLLITFLRHQFIPLEQELSTQGFHCAWDAS